MKTQNFSAFQPLERQLAAYAVAASAGLGVLSSAQVASADIVYFPNSPATVFTKNGSLTLFSGGPNLRITSSSGGFYEYVGITVGAALVKTGNYAANLALNSTIGAGAAFLGGAQRIGYKSGTRLFGNFTNTTGYLGFSFTDTVRGGTDYGWANIGLSNNDQTFTIGSYAYDNTGASIAAGAVPEPTSLGLLAGGASALAAWRLRAARRNALSRVPSNGAETTCSC